MKKIIGMTLLVVGFLLEGFIVLALFLGCLTLLGVMRGGAGFPGFQPILVAGLVLQVPLLALLKAGFALRASSGHAGISPAATINLFLVGLVITVVAFLKTCVPYLQTGSRASGIGALASAATFVVLCIFLFRWWNKTMK
jgi:hypothetical protein